MTVNMETGQENTWCPGCWNFSILSSVKNVFKKLIEEGVKQEDIVISTGVGCAPKIFDYINVGGIYGLHGRVIPTLLGMKIGNPNLTAVGFAGDGGSYYEGIAHLIHAARFNPNMTMVVHNNQNFALTTGQATASSEQGFKSKADPLGVFEEPINPVSLMLSAGASFVARVYSKDLKFMQEVFEKAIKHKGFSFVEVLQPCVQFHNDVGFLDEHIYRIHGNNIKDKAEAMKLANQWDYEQGQDDKIPEGIFYAKERETMEENWGQLKELLNSQVGWVEKKRKKVDIKSLLK
ncbi:MAG: 2-oxoacid:ferredoxin oxidoreductase subunit beta [Nanoarchaeota archaeon]|nr:2-oxoacid:ferredoxin oxidoreductase subunit beta [Nanoarchaeota archaeon]